jgi:hypothetical protein
MSRPTDLDEDRPQTEEEIRAGERKIRRAFLASLAAIAVVAVGVVAVVLLSRGGGEATVEPARSAGPAAAPAIPPEAYVDQVFTDVADTMGVDFRHESGARGEKLLPETLGGGVAIADFDGNGTQDLVFTNGRPWPWFDHDGALPTQKIFANFGAGKFIDVSSRSGLDVPLPAMGVAVGDVDGDGKPDVFISTVGQDRLFRNVTERPLQPRFEEVTDAALPKEDRWGTSAGFLDYDRDGDLDLFVANYVKWTPEIDRAVGYQLTGVGRAYGPPTGFEGVQPFLWRNDGGRFTDVSREAGVEVVNDATGVPVAKALGVTFVDLDRDGWLDILVANDTVRNFLYRNRGDGTFEEIAETAGFAFDRNGVATGAMGIDAADFRDDGRTGVAIGNFANEPASLYVTGDAGPIRVTDDAIAEGLSVATRKPLKFGTLFVDGDLDGREDLVLANGHLEEEINRVYRSQEYRQAGQFFRNISGIRPDGAAFVELPKTRIADLGIPIVGRAAAYGDLDGDRDPDLVLTQAGGPPLVLRNDRADANRVIRLELVGKAPNTSAIGAEVSLRVGDRTLRRRVVPARSYLSSVELPLTFGLGTAAAGDSLSVRWPDGSVQELAGPVAGDATYRLRQGGGIEPVGAGG